MFRILAFIIILIFGTSSSCSEENNKPIISDDPSSLDYSLIQYRGRVEFWTDKACSFSMPGSSIKVKFKGSSLFATFSADNFGGNGYSYLYIITDENADPNSRQIIRIEEAKQEYSLVEGLPDGEHTVEIVKNSECWGHVHFSNLRIPNGTLLALPAKNARLIEYYGDSNPSGWSAWNDKDKGSDADTEGYFSYPGFTARSMDAEWVNYSVGGYGITDRMGNQNLTEYFNKIHVYTNSPQSNTWDFSNNNLGRKPDVIVINLGANDYYNSASQAEIKAAWHRFVSSFLRPEYPDAHIVLANSYGWALGEPTDYLADVIQEFQGKGEQNISYVKFPWLWGQDHAVISEHAGFATILSKHIANIMGWESKAIPYSSMAEEKGSLGNTSFESSILGTRPDGWRPDDMKSNARWEENSDEAKDGSAFVRCSYGYGVHQSVDAQPDEKFKIKVWAKANTGDQGILKYQFRNQEQKTLRSSIKPISLSEQWQQFEFTTENAPSGTWQIDVILKAEYNAIVDYDLIDMTKLDSNSINDEDTTD
jgi:hypothetical protein